MRLTRFRKPTTLMVWSEEEGDSSADGVSRHSHPSRHISTHGSGVSLMDEGNVGGSSPVTHPNKGRCSATAFCIAGAILPPRCPHIAPTFVGAMAERSSTASHTRRSRSRVSDGFWRFRTVPVVPDREEPPWLGSNCAAAATS